MKDVKALGERPDLCIRKHDSIDTVRQTANTRLKVLVVEDIEASRMLVRKVLMDLEIDPDMAKNGKEAMHQIVTNRYDLVLMDLQMPVMDGFLTAKEIRKLRRSKYQQLPIVALTAAAVAEIREEVLRAGMDDVVTKPIDLRKFSKILSEYCSRAASTDSVDDHKEMKQATDQEIIDFSYFLQLAEGDEHFVQRMVYMLVETFESFKSEYQHSFNNQDFNGLSRIRHKIVASLNVLKVKPLLELMDESRKLQRNHVSLAQSALARHLKKVETLTNDVLEGLKRRLSIIGYEHMVQS